MLPTSPFRQLNRCLPLAQLDDPIVLLMFSINILLKKNIKLINTANNVSG